MRSEWACRAARVGVSCGPSGRVVRPWGRPGPRCRQQGRCRRTDGAAEGAGFEPAADITASDRFQGGSDRPLRHPSTPAARTSGWQESTRPVGRPSVARRSPVGVRRPRPGPAYDRVASQGSASSRLSRTGSPRAPRARGRGGARRAAAPRRRPRLGDDLTAGIDQERVAAVARTRLPDGSDVGEVLDRSRDRQRAPVHHLARPGDPGQPVRAAGRRRPATSSRASSGNRRS